MSALRVVQAGPYSTVQDAGRFGSQRFGISPAGAADPALLAIANRLAGNAPDAAAIECTLLGDTYEVAVESLRLAVAGDVAMKIDGEAAAPWRSYRLARGQKLRIGPCRTGLRFYVAVEGGIACAPVLGSRATHVRTGIGGIEGRRLKAGDALPLAQDAVATRPELGFDPARLPPAPERLRVVLGPQDDYFTPAGIATFLGSDYAVARDADRMGCRLEGPAIEHAKGHNIISDGIPLGGIQVPGNGQPIALMRDRQTTGGYPKIACLIGPDVARLAQKRPGEAVRFAALSPAEAQEAVRAQAARLAECLAGIVPLE
ncbi:biotin-dependent carboxyltransferase family protein [Desertibaculum subflavum]|uniref:5-oxoprolinase subunit C family protein n=1 Tax=Desertibaculum subflavum TaxID=2268458 RepID=UPI000E668CD1